MNQRVLFVDDEPNVLQALRRAIRKDVDATIAVGPEAGLEAIANQPAFAVIVSDMRMPGMNGVEFLRAATQLSPDSVRIMLTGNSDQQTAIDAVNQGQVFRFLTKPCDVDQLRLVLSQAIRQFSLVNAERDLLDNTVKGSLGVLTDLLSMAMPEAFGRTCRIKERVARLTAHFPDLSADDRWSIETATMLSQLCCIAMDQDVIAKLNRGESLNDTELAAYHAATSQVAGMVERVPRMEQVARIIANHHKGYDGSGYPQTDLRAEAIPFGARALHLALAIDQLRLRGLSNDEVLEALQMNKRRYDPRLLEKLAIKQTSAESPEPMNLPVTDVQIGMRIEQDITTDSGSLLVCAGQRVSDAIHAHLMSFVERGEMTSVISVSSDLSPLLERTG
ncbi:MAG: HD domain-containing phosphohydrolase [Pseudomonadota bacterium]